MILGFNPNPPSIITIILLVLTYLLYLWIGKVVLKKRVMIWGIALFIIIGTVIYEIITGELLV